MDIFRRQKFNEAMFAKNRTLAIRVGAYQSSDIKEASFDYGYIKGDTYKPGGTCAGSGKITFTSIITTFNKLDKIYPEIGLLVDGTYEWVKMGEYFINDIEIDRNRNTTTLDLMDGMFKLNREYVTDLTFPAEIRQVIKEICLKTGVELANENMGLESMNYAIETKPKEKNKTFRDVLSLATQMLGMSCFFNREGKLEIKELTDSGIVITADNYFLHGLTRSEVEYQIAGITCKKDKEGLTVGARTGRSLEIENPFMTQSILDNLYHKIKDIRYYPFSLNYQGHLLLDVGQWVTIKTNKGETFKAPVLSQSFNFKGGLRSRISADSKAGNDTQYSYAGTITKKIEQFSEFEKQLQNQIEEADRGFDAKVDQIKQDFNDQIELTKAKAEENKKALSDEIDRRFHEFSPAGFEEARNKAEEALKKAGTSAELAEEARNRALANIRDLNTFKAAAEQAQTQLNKDVVNFRNEYGSKMLEVNQTTEGIKTKIGEITSFIDKDGQRQEALKRYAREETAKQTSAIRETISRDYVLKSTFTENVEGINQRFEAITRDNEAKLAEYKQGIDGRFTSLSSQIDSKVNQADFQAVRETSTLYERILGSEVSNITANIARMALTSDLFQVEVGKRFSNLTNLFYAPTKIPKYISSVTTDTHLQRVSWGDHDGIRINYTDSMSGWLGVRFPLTKKFVKQGEGLGYRIEIAVDKVPKDGRVLIQLLDNTTNPGMFYNSQILLNKTGNQVFTGYLDIPYTGELNEYSLRFTLTSPGNIVIHKPMIIDRRLIPEEFVDSTDYNSEYNRVTMSLLQDSFAIKALNSAGDIISQVNLNSNNALIEANKIRLKGRTLADEITAIDGYFKRLFVGDARIGTLNTDIIRSNSIAADKLIFDTALAKKLVASDVFTDTLAAKTAFINKLRSVVVSATLLEGYKGRIGGFQIGTHDKDPSTYWLTGTNQFAVGMSNGSSKWEQTALWVNWGDDWGKVGDNAWYVKRTGEMHCRNTAHFWKTPVVHGDLRVGGHIYYINENDKTGGYWMYSPAFTKIDKYNGYLYFYDFNERQSDWIPLNKEISDRRYKTNIKDSEISALDVVDKLKTYSYRKEYDDKVEDISCGIMAQDVQKYAPEAFYENPDGAYSYRTFELVPYLIKAIQELNQKVERLEKTT
jgi:hypothetical protein